MGIHVILNTEKLTRRQATALLSAAVASPLVALSEKERSLQSRLSDPILVELPGQDALAIRPEKQTRDPEGWDVTEFVPHGALRFRQLARPLNENLCQRSLEVLAEQDATFCS
jgi:hypothetical protein